MTFDWLDIDSIHGDIHGRSCKNGNYNLRKQYGANTRITTAV